MREIPPQAIALITQFEGFRSKPYICPGNVVTIGYGHAIKHGEGFEEITEEDAQKLLMDDLRVFCDGVCRLVKVPLNDNQLSAMISFAYNVGLGAFESSTLLKLLNRGWYEQVMPQLMRWNKANGEELGGLTRRRAAEGLLFNSTASS